MYYLAISKLELLSNEELKSVRGGDAPVDPIIIRNSPMLSTSSTDITSDTKTKKKSSSLL